MDKLLFHHCSNLSFVRYGTFIPAEQHTLNNSYINGWFDDDLPWDLDTKANNWLKNEEGFYPLFMSVGDSIDDIYTTGYQNNWRVTTGQRLDKKTNKMYYKQRRKGEFPNQVLFSFENVDCVFLDHEYWCIIYSNAANGVETTSQEKRWVFKYSWNRSKWLRRAANDPGRVMCVVSRLDLRQADRIWVRNNKTKKALEKMGFENIFAKRIPVDNF